MLLMLNPFQNVKKMGRNQYKADYGAFDDGYSEGSRI